MDAQILITILPTIFSAAAAFTIVIMANFFKDKFLAKLILVSITFVFSILTTGFTIYNQHELERKRVADADNRKSIRETIGTLIEEGINIRAAVRQNIPYLPVNEASNWAEKTEHFLNERLGASFVKRFRDSSGMYYATAPGADKQHGDLQFAISCRITRLEEFSRQIPF